jgi:hypothetical protein
MSFRKRKLSFWTGVALNPANQSTQLCCSRCKRVTKNLQRFAVIPSPSQPVSIQKTCMNCTRKRGGLI